jgi:hypothetical protein
MTPELKGLLLVSACSGAGPVLHPAGGRRTPGRLGGAQGQRDDAGPARTQPHRPVRPPAERRRRHQELLQGRGHAVGADRGIFPSRRCCRSSPPFCMFAVIPFAAPLPGFDLTLPLLGRVVYEGPLTMVVADLPIGFLFIIAFSSLAVYGITLAGWAANSKYALLGGLRASAQMMSYEVTLGIALGRAVLLVAGNVSHSARSSPSSSRTAGSVPGHALPLVLRLPWAPSPRPTGCRSTCRRPSRSSSRATTPNTAR